MADTVRSLRRAAIVWIVAGTVVMYVMALGIKSEADRFPGGAKALAASVQAGAVALRWMRWPAERLDTIGGYLTYHNVLLFVFVLGLYAAAKGVSAVRGAEAKGEIDALLATGVSRRGIVRQRALGFAVVLGLISVGMGFGLALSVAATHEPNLSGSLLTALAIGCSALMSYAVGATVAQLTASPRSGNGVSALLLTSLYVVTNEWQEVGGLGVLRYVSPFYYFTQSRALVPGHGFSVLAALVTLAMAVALVELSGWLFLRRDVRSALGNRRARPPSSLKRIQRLSLRTLWTATLVRERTGLLVWSVSSAVGLGLLAWLEPKVADLWDQTAFIKNILGGNSAYSASEQYLSFTVEIITPIVAAFVLTKASTWVADIRQGRVEILLSTPLSPGALIGQRLAALVAGTIFIALGSLAGLAIGAASVNVTLASAGLVRVAAISLLFALALGAVALFATSWLRSDTAITVLALFLSGSYLLSLLVQLFRWPQWISRATLFGAIGRPYLETPPIGGIIFLAALGAVGLALAVAVAQHSARTA